MKITGCMKITDYVRLQIIFCIVRFMKYVPTDYIRLYLWLLFLVGVTFENSLHSLPQATGRRLHSLPQATSLRQLLIIYQIPSGERNIKPQ